MLNKEIKKILSSYNEAGWVLEPDAKRILKIAGMDVPDFSWATTQKQALESAGDIKYPVVAKVVSPKAVHKSDIGGVVTGIEDDDQMKKVFERFSTIEGFSGILIEKMFTGLELIMGVKMDFQFGPVILFGIGGTGVEIYHDTVLKMAPLNESNIQSMITGLKASRLLKGYRGNPPVHLESLTKNLLKLSELSMELVDEIESADLNPVICIKDSCVVADARIILRGGQLT